MERNYLIWLKSGCVVEGTAKEEEIIKLQNKLKKPFKFKTKFYDNDGYTMINIRRIEAIASNIIAADKVAGM